MDLDPAHQHRVKAEVKRIFAWIRSSPDELDRNAKNTILGPGLGLKNTPIILLSSLAPGADQWVVEAARELDPDIRALAPLPFLKDQYLEASTFNPDGVSKDEAASKFLAEFPDKNVFVVRLLDELDLDDDALRARHKSILTGSAGKQERDRRYAAAGEYVAAYSDILIALTDKPIGEAENAIANPGASEGARAIAELKRRGITSGLLPILPALSWADNGPVIHVYAPRKSKGELGNTAKLGNEVKLRNAEGKSLEVLYPYDCRPPGVSEKENDHPDWLKAGYSILKVVSEHLERLNTEEIYVDPGGEGRAIAKMLPEAPDHSGTQRSHACSTVGEHLQATLDRLARLRCRMASYSAYYNMHLNRLKRALFGLAFASAFFFSLADNWDVKAAAIPIPQAFFVIALGLTLAAWIVFFCFRRSAAAERCDDYRAIAEGLRVQFYWTACGSGESVASNYLQRQRGELGWIRNVISVAAFPYEQARVEFNRLSVEKKRAILDSIRETWIKGQCIYFKNKVDDLSARRDVFSAYAHILLWTGFVLFAFFFFFAQSSVSPFKPRPFALLSFSTGCLVLGVLFCMSAASPKRGTKNQGREANHLPTRSGAGFYKSLAASLPPMFLPKRIQSCKSGQVILNSLLVGALSLVAIGTVYLLEGAVPWIPTAYKLGSIFKYLALVIGILCGAWVEVNFFAEHIRHYASMASLFEAAGFRFQDYSDELARYSEDQKEASDTQAVANIRSLIVAVGREALSENAEWLITHRARPLEPVSV